MSEQFEPHAEMPPEPVLSEAETRRLVEQIEARIKATEKLERAIATRPQPSAEPVAVWNAAVAANIAAPDEPYGTSADAAIAVIASALEAARREDQARIAELEACIDLVIPDDCKSQLHEDATNMLKLQDRIAALEADKARLMGLVKEAGEAVHMAMLELGSHGACPACINAHSGLRATLAKIKETPDA